MTDTRKLGHQEILKIIWIHIFKERLKQQRLERD